MKKPELLQSSHALASLKESIKEKPLKIIVIFKSNRPHSILEHEYEVERFDYSTDNETTDISFILSKEHSLITQQLKNIHSFFLNKNYFFHIVENHFNLINDRELLFSIDNQCHDTFPHINHFLSTGNIKFLPTL